MEAVVPHPWVEGWWKKKRIVSRRSLSIWKVHIDQEIVWHLAIPSPCNGLGLWTLLSLQAEFKCPLFLEVLSSTVIPAPSTWDLLQLRFLLVAPGQIHRLAARRQRGTFCDISLVGWEDPYHCRHHAWCPFLPTPELIISNLHYICGCICLTPPPATHLLYHIHPGPVHT